MRPPPSLLCSALPRASCSTASSSSSSSPLSRLPVRSLHVSSVSLESDIKRKLRMEKKKIATTTANMREDWFNTAPDPFLGMQLVYANGVPIHEQRWRQTKLAATIIDPLTLWTTGINAPKNVFTSLSNAPTSSSSSPDPTNLASPNNPITTRIVTSRLSLQEQLDTVQTEEERSLLVDEEKVLDEEEAIKSLEAELEEKETELRALESLRLEAQELERVESLRDQVMEAAVKLGVLTEEDVTRDHPIVVAELDRILAFAPKKDFPEAVWQPTEDGGAGHWLRKATAVPPLEFPKDAAESSESAQPTTTTNPITPVTPSTPTPAMEALAEKHAVAEAQRAKEASGEHQPIIDSALLPLPVLLAEPAPDYSRSPLVTLFTTVNPIDSFPVPTFIGYLLSEADKRFLFNTLPHVTAQKDIMPLPGVKLSQEDMKRRVQRAEEAMEGERKSLEALGRILSLKNASSKLIAKENRRRVIEAFGQPEVKSLMQSEPKKRKGADSGSPEVVAALLTLQIRNLRAHCMKNMHDKRADFMIKKFTYKRKKLLEYLKRVDRVRYDKCLMEIGVDKRAVEGELIIHRFWRQVIPRGKFSRTIKFVGKVGRQGKLTGHKKINPLRKGGQGLEAHY